MRHDKLFYNSYKTCFLSTGDRNIVCFFTFVQKKPLSIDTQICIHRADDYILDLIDFCPCV